MIKSILDSKGARRFKKNEDGGGFGLENSQAAINVGIDLNADISNA